jgi:hypothetical protein
MVVYGEDESKDMRGESYMLRFLTPFLFIFCSAFALLLQPSPSFVVTFPLTQYLVRP